MATQQPVAAEKHAKGRRKWMITVVAIVAVILVSGYLLTEYLPVSPPAAPSTPNVVIWNGVGCAGTQNCGFVPNVRTVANGTTVTWTNNGGMIHTITTCDASHSVPQCPAMDASGLDSLDANVGAGSSYSHTFNKPGDYFYYCSPHPWMQAEIIVQGPGSGY